MNKLKEIASSKLFLIIVAVIAFFIVKELKIAYYDNKVVSKYSEMYDSIVSKTKEGEYASDNVKEEFTKITKDELDKVSGFEKTNKAANNFWGAYAVNVTARYDFCKENGVDITKFVVEFKKVNASFYKDYVKTKKQYAINSGILFSEDILKKEEEKLSVKLKDYNKKVITQGMIDASEKWNTNGNMKLTCEFLNDNSEELAKLMSLDKIMPDIIKTLVDGASLLK
jgi:hypothetical protein